MTRRPAAAIAALALAVSLAGGAAVLAQNQGDYGSNAGSHEASGAGTDGNVVVSGRGGVPRAVDRPVGSVTPGGAAPTATAAAGSGTSSAGGVVIPPNPALTGQNQPGSLAPTITEETTSGDSVLGPTPTPLPAAPRDTAVTSDDSADSTSGSGAPASTSGGRRTGDASVSAVDGDTIGGSINETIPGTTGTAPSGTAPTNRSARGACGYPSWLDAQTALETQWTVELADELDPDRDGIACEEAMY